MLKNLDDTLEYICTHKAKLIIASLVVSIAVSLIVPDTRPIINNYLKPELPA